MTTVLFILAAILLCLNQPTVASPRECKRFHDIFKDGKDLCERIFGEAFVYVDPSDKSEYDLAYTMWFFTAENPNDKVSEMRKALGKHTEYNDSELCYLNGEATAHKPRAYAENTTFTECQPFRKNACCEEKTVENSSVINNLYGPKYRWDRCGYMSKECERFFVQENCFYECDKNAGLFRRHPPTINGVPNPNATGNEWEIYKMPIRGDYCDAWLDTCRWDSFCSDGNFFSEACEPVELPPPGLGQLTSGQIAGAIIGAILLACLLLCMFHLIRQERNGTPVFGAINMDDSKPLTANGGNQAAQGNHVTAV